MQSEYRKTSLSTPVGGIATTMVDINSTLVCLDFSTNFFLTPSTPWCISIYVMGWIDLHHGTDVVRKYARGDLHHF
jgi:hypothetical protein